MEKKLIETRAQVGVEGDDNYSPAEFLELDYDPVAKKFTIELDEPITFGSDEITQVTVKRPLWKEYKLIKVGKNGEIDLDNITLVASKLTGLNVPQLDCMIPADMMKIVAVLGFFSDRGASQKK